MLYLVCTPTNAHVPDLVLSSQNPSQDLASYLRVRAHCIGELGHSYDRFCYLTLGFAPVSTGKVSPSSRRSSMWIVMTPSPHPTEGLLAPLTLHQGAASFSHRPYLVGYPRPENSTTVAHVLPQSSRKRLSLPWTLRRSSLYRSCLAAKLP